MSWHKGGNLIIFVTFVLLVGAVICRNSKRPVINLSEDNWTDILQGEWLVAFYAPWCPACRALEPEWEKVATWQDDLSINVAKIDVTENPALSGRFFVTALPTIYHVKDGEFRQYKEGRDEDSLVSFVDDGKWKNVTPVPWYSSPKSAHMSVMGWFFKASIAIRDLHNQMTDEYGIPVWGSYIIFALLTVVIGLILGLCIVCACDYCCPATPIVREPSRYSHVHPDQKRPPYEQEESNSVEDSTEEQTSATGGDVEPSEVRRRPKKDS